MKIKLFLLTILAITISTNAFSVCAFGTIDETVWGTPDDFAVGFTADSDIADEDTIQVVQGEDTTIYIQYLLPKKAVTGFGTATINSVEILGVTGLPIGMSWVLDVNADAAGNTYYPQTYRFGTVTICGSTFSSPGLKTITITVDGCGSVSGISDCQVTTFQLYMEVLPGSGGNSAFTMTPPLGCNNFDVDFEAIFPSPDPVFNPLDFAWNFGDGSTGTGQTITAHNYNSVGDYTVQLDAIINEYYISHIDLSNITSVSDPFNDVDVFGTFNGTVLAEVGNDDTPEWTVDIPLSAFAFNCDFTDADNPPLDANDDMGSYSGTFLASSLYDGSTMFFDAAGYRINLIINKRINSILPFYDTVSVFANSTATITTSNGTVFCEGDSTILDLGTSSTYDYIQWYNDTTLLLGENSQTLIVKEEGSYFAEILESGNICSGISNTIIITIDNVTEPIITQNASGLEVDNPTGFSVQWYSNNVPIPSATSNVLTDLSSGSPFSVVFMNVNGCFSTSSDFTAMIAGTSTQSGAVLTASQNIIFNANGFNLCPGQEIAWAVSSQSDGAITDMTSLQTAIDNGWVYPSSATNEFDANCISTEFPPGDYYMTPVSVDAIDIEDVYWNSNTDSNYCDASMEVCITLTGTDYSVLPFEIVLPNGVTVDVLDELAGLGGIAITPSLWATALAQGGGGTALCLDLIDLMAYYGNPNGDWIFKIPNNGSGDIDFNIADFNIVVDASTCDSLATDQITPVAGISGSVAGGEYGEFTVTVPPFPTDFPNVTPSCVLFGTSTSFNSTCVLGIEDILVEDLNIYPNPNNGLFNLEFSLNETNDVELSILDLTGRRILNREYLNVKGDFKESFDLKNNLTSGFYIINIQIGNSNTQQKFIIK